mmetsp:Transcript_113750/g.321683  ORF Transcript_113750/g.321683 Transcript_113750/m.321683 type:complete len:218 (+) Transcript_113750:778-1431(+)
MRDVVVERSLGTDRCFDGGLVRLQLRPKLLRRVLSGALLRKIRTPGAHHRCSADCGCFDRPRQHCPHVRPRCHEPRLGANSGTRALVDCWRSRAARRRAHQLCWGFARGGGRRGALVRPRDPTFLAEHAVVAGTLRTIRAAWLVARCGFRGEHGWAHPRPSDLRRGLRCESRAGFRPHQRRRGSGRRCVAFPGTKPLQVSQGGIVQPSGGGDVFGTF